MTLAFGNFVACKIAFIKRSWARYRTYRAFSLVHEYDEDSLKLVLYVNRELENDMRTPLYRPALCVLVAFSLHPLSVPVPSPSYPLPCVLLLSPSPPHVHGH